MGEGLSLTSTVTLSGGVEIPALGLGVFRSGRGQATRDAVSWALAHGYRHIDTARVYGNEKDVGAALQQSPVSRDEVFVTTKLWNDDHGYDQTLRAFDKSAAALGIDVVDLYLMHWPVEGKRLDSWRAMEKLLADGRVRAIGVSNFVVRHLEELLAHASVKPAINQIELHPFCQQRDTVAWCRDHDVAVEAYSPLTKGKRLDDARLVALATVTGKTPAQVLIRWSLQRGFVCIPKSAHPARIEANADVFDFVLTDEQMAQLDALDEQAHLAWDPNTAA